MNKNSFTIKNLTIKQILIPIISLFIAFNQISFAQNQNRIPDRSNYFVFGDNFFAQTFAMPSTTMDSINILFCYSFVYDGLIFQKTANDQYFAVPNLEATFKDNDGITRKRLLTNDTIWTDGFDETNSKTTFSNIATFSLPKKDYKISVKLNNSKSSRNIILESKIQGFDSLTKTETILQPFFMQSSGDNIIYFPFLSNNYIPFSAKNFTIFIPVSIQKTADNTAFDYKIERNEMKEKGIKWGDFYSISGNCELIKNVNFATAKGNNEIHILLVEDNYITDNYDFALLRIDVSMAQFSPANYSISIKNNRTNYERNFDFEVRWNDVPLSLINPDYAAEQMYLILTDSEYKKLKSGNKTEIFNNILNYWKERDPTPATEYNEAMTEYFRRVDYAFFNYQTIIQREGSKTDRGKVYILNGKPDKIENDMNDKKSREIWTYVELEKRYIFDLISVGFYKLVKIEDM